VHVPARINSQACICVCLRILKVGFGFGFGFGVGLFCIRRLHGCLKCRFTAGEKRTSDEGPFLTLRGCDRYGHA
jgi:hypothetical protein